MKSSVIEILLHHMFSNMNQSVIEGGNKNTPSKKTHLKKEKYIDTLYDADFIKNYFS